MVLKIQKLLKDRKLLFGKERTLNMMKQGRLEEIFISSNFPDKNNIKQLADISDTKVSVLKQTNEELGALCKKPFSIAIIGLIKE